jgi:peptidyl-prolyl cis-trans isomerase SurA
MKSRFVWTASLSLLLAASAHAVVLERVIAKVNGEIITLSELEQRQVAAAQSANVPADKIDAYLQEKSGEILQEAIDELLLSQKAEDVGIKVRPEALDQVLADIKKENKITTDEQFQAELAREGVTVEALRRNIERSIVRRRLLSREIETKITVPDDEIRAEYQRRQKDFRLPASVQLQEIVLAGDDAKAKAAAEDLAKRVRAGEDFAALAKEHSISPTRATGGDLGRMALGELHADLRRAIEGLAVGQVSAPTTVGGNVRILKVVDRTDARTVPYEEARSALEQRMKQERMAQALTPYLENLRKQAVIDVRVREVPHNISMPATNDAPAIIREQIVPDMPAGAIEDEPAPAK